MNDDMSGMRNENAPHVDYGFLEGCIASNPKALPSNIDGVLERNGYFLFLEWKRQDEKLSVGQAILLKNLAKLDRVFVVIVTGYSTKKETAVDLVATIDSKSGAVRELGSSVEELKEVIRKFYAYAERKK